MRHLLAIAAGLAAIASSSSSFGLEQSKHRAISRDACSAAGLPWGFCERVGTEAYNVDSYEWNDLSAHAQVDVKLGQDACTAANLTAGRVYWLGSDARQALFAKASGASWADGTLLAEELGRALHTVQDNCAHSGMTNPQHAWYSLSDSCSSTKLSPDIQASAIACAKRETQAVMDAFTDTLAEAGLSPDDLSGVDEGSAHWPARGDVCAFLKEGNSWSGADTRWDNGVAVPALEEQMVAGLRGGYAPADVCDGDPNGLRLANPAPVFNTSGGQKFCFKIKLYCLGKADGAADEPPPWEDPAETAADDNASPPPSSGCTVGSTGHAGGASTAWALALVLGALVARRRHRR
jgi:MYXO-CTERM domain-containing protein